MSCGVSLVICCHNGARLLARTLEHLAAQRVPSELAWEVLLVDNASTDGTAEVARQSWTRAEIPLRVVPEPRLGLSNARERGFEKASYDLVSFVDDDNWVAEDWVVQVAKVMSEHPEAGACGGVSTAVFEVSPPSWFTNYQNYYAIGGATGHGQYTDVLWAAGMTVRRPIWKALRRAGFVRMTTSFGEDHEIALALRLSGWKLWNDPRLRFQHFLPARRLNWTHFLRVQRDRSTCLVDVDPYSFALSEGAASISGGGPWLNNMASALSGLLHDLMLHPHKTLGRKRVRLEGDEDVFRIECRFGRLRGLMKARRVYNSNVRMLMNCGWRAEAGPAALT